MAHCTGFGWGGVYFFFTVTGKRLCLGLVPNAELVVQGCVSPCWAALAQHKDCAAPHLSSSRQGRRHSWTADLTDRRAIPAQMALCPAVAAGGRRRKGDLWSDGICLSQPRMLEPCSRMTGHLAAHGKWGMNFLLCLTCAWSFRFFYYTVFISTQEFLHFYPSILSSSREKGGVSERLWDWTAHQV